MLIELTSTMPLEPHKILAVVKDLVAVRTSDNIATVAALAATNSELRALCLPYLFAHVRWPHPTKYDEEVGLHFFPESLWPLFKYICAAVCCLGVLTGSLQTIRPHLARRLA
jgi:hypothetical protein